MILKRNIMLSAAVAAVLSGCGSSGIAFPELTQNQLQNSAQSSIKNVDLTEDTLKSWGHADINTDTIPGMSVEKAYAEIINNLTNGSTVIVGVIDSGVDIAHEDLDGVIWTNEDEIPGNGIDDDKNGYVDDVHGWNFLGDATLENLEFTRIVKSGDTSSKFYEKAKAELEEKTQTALGNKQRYEMIYQNVEGASTYIREKLGVDGSLSAEDLENLETENDTLAEAAAFMQNMFAYADNDKALLEELKGGIEHFTNQLNYNYNTEFDGRAVVGDDPNDFSQTSYGNNDVTGDVDHSRHGTHVAGIIAAERNNDLGMNGVANNVKIMSVRAVPDGDEYDKDIALAIRYAVDNGAKVINGSFGKYYSPHAEKVREAIKYAASKDVLIVKAAGNEGYLLDETNVYPNDNEDNSAEVADNFLTVGALNYAYGPEMVATFSNYGKIQVDVFAPGTKIWSTTPRNTYEFLQGTSMAAPAVAGVAAVIRSYYPSLTAAEVKKIIMNSGLPSPHTVIVSGDPSNKQPFTNLSKSGKMVNLYNAMLLADKVARKKITL